MGQDSSSGWSPLCTLNNNAGNNKGYLLGSVKPVTAITSLLTKCAVYSIIHVTALRTHIAILNSACEKQFSLRSETGRTWDPTYSGSDSFT
ncbi:hypothetical protein HHUSO_G12782 [Huso huso]|uniref:Uncharacterized protein n=1 Tax=Huso huso TaxID=61971 RepID=A0ABR0ZJC0_HUSHU